MSCGPAASGGTCRRPRHFRRGRRFTATSACCWPPGSGKPPIIIWSRPGVRRPGSQPDRRDHRHAECQDDGKGGSRGSDAAKKINGRKRHIAVDTPGLLLDVRVHAADIQDADSAGDLLKRVKHLYCWLQAVFTDSIYDRLPVLIACLLLGLTLIIVRRIAGSTGFVIVPHRWVVERTLG